MRDSIKVLAVVIVLGWFAMVSNDTYNYISHWHADIGEEIALHGEHRKALVHLFY